MTGRIEALSRKDAEGAIRAEGGATVHFRLSEVALRDAADLAVGQLVTFDVERGDPPNAFNIFAKRQQNSSKEMERRQEALRYLGFEQTGNVRSYKFERLSPSGETDRAVVSADLSLFHRHEVGIQEGPTLCLRLVTAELDGFNTTNATGDSPFQRSLTDHDMLNHLAACAVRRRKGSPRRSRVAGLS